MTQPTRYKTLNGRPPNGGVPPSRMFASVIGPSAHEPHDAGPPNGGMVPHGPTMWSPPPTYVAPPPTYVQTYPPVYVPAPPPPPPPPASYSSSTSISYNIGPVYRHRPTAASPPPPPPPTPYYPLARMPGTYPAPFEPPGQWVSGEHLHGSNWSYLAPAEHTTIMFINNGARPCDYPSGYFPQEFPFSKHKVACNMTIRELIKQLGCPEAPGTFGVTEIIQLGDNYWAAGSTFTQGGDESKKTLAEVGWTARRSEDYPVWLAVKYN